jgi:hypothetical protein
MNTYIYKGMYVPMEAALCHGHDISDIFKHELSGYVMFIYPFPLFVLVLNFDLLMYNYSKSL